MRAALPKRVGPTGSDSMTASLPCATWCATPAMQADHARQIPCCAGFWIISARVGVLVVPTHASAQTDFCGAGEALEFRSGFALLASQLGAIMGDPIECEHGAPATMDTLQATTTGLAYYRRALNTPIFTDGRMHYAWTTQGLVVRLSPSLPGPSHPRHPCGSCWEQRPDLPRRLRSPTGDGRFSALRPARRRPAQPNRV